MKHGEGSREFTSCCRTCLDTTVQMFNLFSTYNEYLIADLFSMCTDIKVAKDDNLPKQICLHCYNKLINFSDYKKQALVIDAQLKAQLLESTDTSTLEIKLEEEIVYTEVPIDGYDTDDSKIQEKDVKLGKSKTNTKHRCTICSQSFKTQFLLDSHIKKHKHTDNTKLSTNNLSQYDIKEEKSEKIDMFECDECYMEFHSSQSLAAHKRRHTKPNRVLSCSICDKIFKKVSHLKRHELIHDINRPFKCCLCSKSFNYEKELVAHMNKHRGISASLFKCKICSKEFSYKSTLNAHLKIHTGEKPFLCPTCGKTFDSSTNLKQHVKRHNGEKLFECELCPKKFVSKGELKSHTVTHTGRRAWTCDECGSSFTKSTSLTKHKLRHLGLKPHHCDVCPMKFTSKDNLKRHYRIHTGEKPYQCPLCERAFRQTSDLVKHKRSHLGDKLYQCEQCQSSFRLKSELTQHLSEHYVSSRAQPDPTDDNKDSVSSVKEEDRTI